VPDLAHLVNLKTNPCMSTALRPPPGFRASLPSAKGGDKGSGCLCQRCARRDLLRRGCRFAMQARELHVWCEKEAASRAAVAATPGRTPSKPLVMTAAARGTPASAIKSAIRHPTVARGLY